MLTFRWTDKTKTMISAGNGWFIPVDERNRHYQEIKPVLEFVLEPEEAPAPDDEPANP